MAQQKNASIADHASAAQPRIRRITVADLKDALARGVDDFMEMPSHAIFLCLIFPIVGLLLGGLTLGYSVLPLFYPLATGFALVGPFAGIGLYELSRRREHGLEVSAAHAFDVTRSPSRAAILSLGALLTAIFLLWLAVAKAIYQSLFGPEAPASMSSFLHEVLNTSAGWKLIVIGNGVGLIFAALVLAISVVSFPMLVDRKVDALTAVYTSARAVIANPVTMAIWGLIVAALLAIGSLPLFVGLAVIMPVLGHATWHLYRKTVAF
jgi:uncharacterized membrane protein